MATQPETNTDLHDLSAADLRYEVSTLRQENRRLQVENQQLAHSCQAMQEMLNAVMVGDKK